MDCGNQQLSKFSSERESEFQRGSHTSLKHQYGMIYGSAVCALITHRRLESDFQCSDTLFLLFNRLLSVRYFERVSPPQIPPRRDPPSPPCCLLKLSQACFYLVMAGMCRCMRGGHRSSRPAMALPCSLVNAAKIRTLFPTHAAFVPFIKQE